jgi:hypothetical protein
MRLVLFVLIAVGLTFLAVGVAEHVAFWWKTAVAAAGTLVSTVDSIHRTYSSIKRSVTRWTSAPVTQVDVEDEYIKAAMKFERANEYVYDSQLQIEKYAQDIMDQARIGYTLHVENEDDQKNLDRVNREITNVGQHFQQVAVNYAHGKNIIEIAKDKLQFVLRDPTLTEAEYLLSVKRGAQKFRNTMLNLKQASQDITFALDLSIDASTDFCNNTVGNIVMDYNKLIKDAEQGLTLTDYIKIYGITGIPCLLAGWSGIGGTGMAMMSTLPLVGPVLTPVAISSLVIGGLVGLPGYFMYRAHSDKLMIRDRAVSMIKRLNGTANMVAIAKTYSVAVRPASDQVTMRTDTLIADIDAFEDTQDPTIVQRFVRDIAHDFGGIVAKYESIMDPLPQRPQLKGPHRQPAEHNKT